MEKEVEDIIQECIKPNFVELPEVIECLPSPDMRGKFDVNDTDVEEISISPESANDVTSDIENEQSSEEKDVLATKVKKNKKKTKVSYFL